MGLIARHRRAPDGGDHGVMAGIAGKYRFSRHRPRNRSVSRKLSDRGDTRVIAMKSQYLVAALFAVCAVAIGVGASSIRSGGDFCPNPSAASVTALFAPCQTFDAAMGREVSKREAVQMGLLTPEIQPEPATRFAQQN
jgi:hypothetical protein